MSSSVDAAIPTNAAGARASSSLSRSKKASECSNVSVSVSTTTNENDFSSPFTKTRPNSPPKSPLSPARTFRRQEHEQLSSLNDRLAQYIDRVRQLEQENAKLTQRHEEIVSFKNRSYGSSGPINSNNGEGGGHATSPSVFNIRQAFCEELREARGVVDETLKESDVFKLTCQAYKHEHKVLTEKCEKLESNLSESKTKRAKAEREMHNMSLQITVENNLAKEYKTEYYQDLEPENEDLKARLAKLLEDLANERQASQSRELMLHSAQESLASQKKNLKQDLEHSRFESTETYFEQIDKQLEVVYTNKLHESLNEMRQEMEEKIAKNRFEIGQMYDNELKRKHELTEDFYRSELESKKELQVLMLQLREFESFKSACESKIKEAEQEAEKLASKLDANSEQYAQRLQRRDETLHKLKGQMSQMLTNYEDLMGTKVQLTLEIEQYRKMMEAEEERLHLSPIVEQTSVDESTGKKRTFKRAKRLLLSKSSLAIPTYENQVTKGCSKDAQVSISEMDHEGSFVQLMNITDEDVALGNWTIKCTCSDDENPVVSYKFRPKFVLKANKTVTIHSCDSKSSETSSQQQENSVAMKNQKWPPLFDRLKFVLYNTDDEEVAWYQLDKIQVYTAEDDEFEKEPNKHTGRCTLM